MTRHPYRPPRRNPLITLTVVMAALVVLTIAIPSLWPATTTAVHLGIAVIAPIAAEVVRQLHDRTPRP
ncbi:hypothetical protein [Mycobacterium sp. shizuoka-1]|uniref:hypothetical protein n=1 Tax=Mycobacterium sp. shizuoka-1 TaxID=2039281 RepID=UPI000C063BB2|nr:hypothetical protein [Mycobacterium sp. shizuoka-1]GAY19295.1 hypothetical protein MSZK_60210 [Mycobacterium sp. shizuoka-1]